MLGHKFGPRHDEVLTPSHAAAGESSSRQLTYVCDVCVRCGLVVRRSVIASKAESPLFTEEDALSATTRMAREVTAPPAPPAPRKIVVVPVGANVVSAQGQAQPARPANPVQAQPHPRR